MKGIILAGGSGTRLFPLTRSISKQILPIYDKPLIYYPLSVLMLAGIRDIMIITTPRDIPVFKELLEDGSLWGLRISYAVQEAPNGIGEAFLIGEDFIGSDSVALILGDNVFYGRGFSAVLEKAATLESGARIFGYYVSNPQDFGVVCLDKNGMAVFLEEKPEIPKSNYAVPGLYFYDNRVVDVAKRITPSKRGELEITSINKWYMENRLLTVSLLGRGMTWLDTGTHEGLLEASNFVSIIQRRQGLYISCVEEIAFKKGYIDAARLIEIARSMDKTEYGQYLKRLVEEEQV